MDISTGSDTAMGISSGMEKLVVDSDDQAALAAIGKKSAFTRRFNFWTALAITVCISGTWEGISAALLQALLVGGPVGLFYGYILTALAMTCVAASLAELASIWPSSGAQYHWTAELAPPRARSILSWFAGWIVLAYLWLGSVACAMGVGVQVQAYVSVGNAHYAENAERWHVYVIYVAVCVLYLFVNIFGMKWLHPLNLFAMFLHVAFYFITIVLLPVMTKSKHTSSYVFTEFSNSSGWPNDGVAFCVGIMTTMFGFGGIESAAHFAEEIKHVSISLPRAMFWTVAINAIMCLPWIIVLIYCMGDLDTLLANPISLTSPITVIFLNTTGSPAAAIILAGMGSYLALVGGADSLGACARAIWSMARDNAFPEPFKRLHPTLNVPIWCIIVAWVPMVLIGLIYIWNQTAFYGVISGVLVLYTCSILLPVALHLLYARRNVKIVYGPWNLGKLGVPLNIVALCWSIFILIFLCFPVYYPVNAANMNYAVAILGGFSVLSLVTYVTYGRKRFKGPIVEILVVREIDSALYPVTTTSNEPNSEAIYTVSGKSEESKM